MSEQEQKGGRAVDWWARFKEDQPEMAAALSIAPGTGQLAAIADYYKAIEEGDTEQAVMAAISFVPGLGLIKGGKAFRLAGKTLPITPKGGVITKQMHEAKPAVERALWPATKRANEIGNVGVGFDLGEGVVGSASRRGSDVAKASGMTWEDAFSRRATTADKKPAATELTPEQQRYMDEWGRI
jgi:hypothetical protein